MVCNLFRGYSTWKSGVFDRISWAWNDFPQHSRQYDSISRHAIIQDNRKTHISKVEPLCFYVLSFDHGEKQFIEIFIFVFSLVVSPILRNQAFVVWSQSTICWYPEGNPIQDLIVWVGSTGWSKKRSGWRKLFATEELHWLIVGG